MYLSDHERGIVIRALTKVLASEPPYARADEYKKLLDRLKGEDEKIDNSPILDRYRYDIDET